MGSRPQDYEGSLKNDTTAFNYIFVPYLLRLCRFWGDVIIL